MQGWERYEGPTAEQLANSHIEARVRALAVYDRELAEELGLQALQQFLIAKTPIDLIAARMGITPNAVSKMKVRLRERVRADIREMDFHSYAGELLGQLKEAAALGFREAAAAGPKEWARRMRGVEVAMKAINDQSKFLQLAGAFDGAPLRAAIKSDDEENSGANVLKELAKNFLTGSYDRSHQIPAGATIIDAEPE